MLSLVYILLDAGYSPLSVGMASLAIASIIFSFIFVGSSWNKGSTVEHVEARFFDFQKAKEGFQKVTAEAKMNLGVFKNQVIDGLGGNLVWYGGRTRALVIGFDYLGYGAEENGLTSLSCSPDAKRFAGLCKACRVETTLLLDTREWCSQGFPTKQRVVDEIKRIAGKTGPTDTFVFFFAGHGTQSADPDDDRDEADGKDEELCICNEDGSYNALKDDEIAKIVLSSFRYPQSKILFVTDCCQSGTVCDLSRPEFEGRQICHIAAVKDSQFAQDLGDGGAFTSSLLETIETLVKQGCKMESIKNVFNLCFQTYSSRFEKQDFQFEQPLNFDADTFAWPLMPPAGWETYTQLDRA